MQTKLLNKINKIKQTLQNTPLKKSGYNSFAKWYYMELNDFLPTLLKLMDEQKVLSTISFGTELATLTLIDIEDGETMVYTSPMSSAALKGVHEVQNLGAVQTYLRRYLYVAAFDIADNDLLDKTSGDEKKIEAKVKTIEEVEDQISKTEIYAHLKNTFLKYQKEFDGDADKTARLITATKKRKEEKGWK